MILLWSTFSPIQWALFSFSLQLAIVLSIKLLLIQQSNLCAVVYSTDSPFSFSVYSFVARFRIKEVRISEVLLYYFAIGNRLVLTCQCGYSGLKIGQVLIRGNTICFGSSTTYYSSPLQYQIRLTVLGFCYWKTRDCSVTSNDHSAYIIMLSITFLFGNNQ